jgi:Tfp pilus assembly protein PilN
MPDIKINLLPSSQKQPLVVFDRALAIGVAVIVIEVLAIVGTVAIVNHRIAVLNDQIAAQEQQLTIVQAQVKDVDALREQVQSLEAKAESLERIKQSPIQLAEILQDLADNTPSGVWFNNVVVSHPRDGGFVTLDGKTSSYREVADLMLNLDSSPMFGNANLTTTRTSVPAQGNAGGGNVSFTMTGDLSPAVVGQ